MSRSRKRELVYLVDLLKKTAAQAVTIRGCPDAEAAFREVDEALTQLLVKGEGGKNGYNKSSRPVEPLSQIQSDRTAVGEAIGSSGGFKRVE